VSLHLFQGYKVSRHNALILLALTGYILQYLVRRLYLTFRVIFPAIIPRICTSKSCG
jgi:hypothetical protein